MIFQSTLRRTERLQFRWQYRVDSDFNPRSDERSDAYQYIHQCCFHYFNPRSDERSDMCLFLLAIVSCISIHAPTNGATTVQSLTMLGQKFQSTLRRTERRAPPASTMIACYFNPRSDERSDIRCVDRYGGADGFQSTLRRTERRAPPASTMIACYFNPRSDERSDESNINKIYSVIISIHAPTNGATLIDILVNVVFVISIHAPTNGATAILHKKMKKTIQNRLIILLFSTNSLRLLCSCTQYSFFLFIFHGANDLVILCSLSFRTTSKN